MRLLQVNTRQQTERVAKKGPNSPVQLPVTAGGMLIQIFQVNILLICLHLQVLVMILTSGLAFSIRTLSYYQVIRNEGLGGLYSGLKPSLLGTAVSQVT